jgi:hypothetical protein
MKSKRNLKKNKKGGKSLKGGFFSSSNKVKPYPGQCDMNQLTELKTTEEMHKNYQVCCPKGSFGTKNSSPYCKKLDLNFQSSLAGENNANEYHGFEPEEVYNMTQNNSQPVPAVQLTPLQNDVAAAAKKPWYKFWGGKKSKRRRSTHRKRKYSRKHRQ